ncbi:MAG: HAD family hydrolase [Candidatus Tectomicrobia bacterium]|uniref:phosphoglycolate phosphatase n=1 Tax=Tectimicrobiota bacterium TaxID=2528274 RepID=A0A933LQI5_UNCTE|nr:HAD family hydrolase [Candidatus Tectomicrobia bacterium]
MKSKIIIFDLDGVITSEEIYWDCARLTLLQIMEDHSFFGLANIFSQGRPLTPDFQKWKYDIIAEEDIVEFKNRAVNSNWDITYICLALSIIYFLKMDSALVAQINSLPTSDGNFWQNALGLLKEKLRCSIGSRSAGTFPLQELCRDFFARTMDLKGLDLFSYLSVFGVEETGIKNLQFKKRDYLWNETYKVFQNWYLDSKNKIPLGPLKPEEPVIDSNRIRLALTELKRNGALLGIATGRPRQEVIPVLETWNLANLFEKPRIITVDEVRRVEKSLQITGREVSLSKPHPYTFLKAAFPDEEEEALITREENRVDHRDILIVGDSSSDMIGAKAAGFLAIGVLTGLGKAIHLKERRKELLLQTGADIIINDITELPEII